MDPERSQDQVEIKLKLPSEKKPDVFDQTDFDATKFINTIYPDESSLTDIDRFISVLKKQASGNSFSLTSDRCQDAH
jgi:hypothetical protein